MKLTVEELTAESIEIRKALVTMIYQAKAGHIGGALSATDLITALYFSILNIDPKNPNWEDRDYFVLSKGHSVEPYLVALARRGFFPVEELSTFSQFGSRLIGHPNNEIPGVEMNTGALGHGLSIAVGMAIGLKKSQRENRVFTLMGDGELAEGSIWEAAMAASHYKLDNLIGIIDRNHLQISGSTEDVMTLEPLAERWMSFGWEVREIDGNDMPQIVQTLQSTAFVSEKPSLIIAHTVKGKGVTEIENLAHWHHGVPNEALYKTAIAGFNRQLEELNYG